MDHQPPLGGRYLLRPTADGNYTVEHTPLAHPNDRPMTDDECRHFAQYANLSRLELMRRCRRYEWDANRHEKRADVAERQLRQTPPMHQIHAMADRLRRIRALTEVPRRRVIPKHELLTALDGRPDPDE